MHEKRSTWRWLGLAAAWGPVLLTPTVATAATASAESAPVIEEVVVTGTRRAGLNPAETLSPVDVISGDLIGDQASFDLTDSLTSLTPSLNTQRFPIADGTALIRPVTLRNLSPDHTLVLVNGARRHRSALVNLQLAPLGTANQGSQGIDWSALPAAAIERVEVLRDGASAQYGSDAIAGVVNVILKDDTSGLNVSTQYGGYYEGDGDRLRVSANGGLPIGSRGFVNATVEYAQSDKTDRGNPRPDAVTVGQLLGDPNLVPLNGFGQRWGDPDTESVKAVVNTGFDLTDQVEVYGFGTFMDKSIESDFFYRTPVLTNPADQVQVPARTTLQIDNDGDGLPDPAAQTLVDSIIGAGLDPADYLVADATSPSGFVLRNPIFTQFPGGYNPDFGADIQDFEVVAGVRGEVVPNLQFDLSGRFGRNEIDYSLANSINPSLGRLSPLKFSPGNLVQREASVNLDFVRTYDNLPINVAFGIGWRNEVYKLSAGDLPSIQAGPTAAIFGVGSDGFQGFPVESAGLFDRPSFDGYLDVEGDITDRLSAAFAIRYEDFSPDFDPTTDWKLSARYEVSDQLAIRATVNTGFRTPTPGQVNTLNVTTTADASGALIPNGTFPVDNPVARVLGAVPLDPEESFAYTIGAVVTPLDNTTVTVDYYNIRINDRLALLNKTINASQVARLAAEGVPNANLLLNSSANFFVNGFDSRVQGVDLALTTTFDDVLGGVVSADLRHSFNQQDISNVAAGTINQSRVYDLEHQVPQHRTVLTVTYTRDRFDGLVRVRRYGDWSTTGGLFSPGDASDQFDYGGDVLVDLELGVDLIDHLRLTVGGENIFDVDPPAEKEPVSRFLGVDKALTSPYGIDGGFWYVRLTAAM